MKLLGFFGVFFFFLEKISRKKGIFAPSIESSAKQNCHNDIVIGGRKKAVLCAFVLAEQDEFFLRFSDRLFQNKMQPSFTVRCIF